MNGDSREADDLKITLMRSKTNLYNLRGNETTVHPFLVTELLIRNARGVVVKRIRMARGEAVEISVSQSRT